MNKIALKWFASYILLIIGVTAVLLISSANNIRSFTEQIDKYAVSVMNNKKQSMDYMFNTVEGIAQDLSIRKDVTDLASKAVGSVDTDTFFELYDLKEMLTGYRILEGNISNVFICFPKADYIMGFSSGNSIKNYYNTYYAGSGINYDQWKGMMVQRNNGTFFRLSMGSVIKPEDNILYLYSIQKYDMSECIATIGIELSPNRFIDTKDGSRFCIMDDDDILFSNTDEIQDEEIKKYLSEADNIVNHVKINGEERVVLKSDSDISELMYVFMTDVVAFRDQTKEMNRIIWVYAALSFALGILLAYVLTKRNYKPVKNLVENVSEKIDSINIDQMDDAFKYLQTTISDVLSKNDTLSNENNELRSENSIRDAVFKNTVAVKAMMNEKIGNTDAAELLKGMGMGFKHDYFIVMIYRLQTDNTDDTEETISSFLVNSMIEECLGKFYSVMRFEVDYLFGYIINAEHMNELDRVCEILSTVHDMVKYEFGFTFRTALSNEYSSISSLPACYAEAMECANSLFLETEPIVLFRDISGRKKPKYYYPAEKEQILINCLRAGEAEEGKAIIEELFNMNIRYGAGFGIITQCLVYDLVGTLAKLLTDVNDNNLLERLNSFLRMSAKPDINEIKYQLYDIVDEFCQMYGENQDTKAHQIVDMAKKYINENYTNPDINREMIASYVNISVNYLSTMFKRSTGIGLLEYIVEVRMEEAKRLLGTTNLSVEEISGRVGYLNTRTFSRVFLKSTGIQPGKYRKMNSSF